MLWCIMNNVRLIDNRLAKLLKNDFFIRITITGVPAHRKLDYFDRFLNYSESLFFLII